MTAVQSAHPERSRDSGGVEGFECGVCWYVYDPAGGDPVWQVPAGTAFSELPERWSCPNCDAPREKFLAL